MKEYLLGLLNNSKNLDKFFMFISKEKDPNVFVSILDKDLTKAYKRAYERDILVAQKLYPKELKEAISSCRYIASTLMETQKFGNRFFFKEKGIHDAVDFIEKEIFINQIKRIKKMDESFYQELESVYTDKAVTTLRVYVAEENEFIGEHTTKAGMKFIIKSEESLKTDFSDEDLAKTLDHIRQMSKTEIKTLLVNESHARKMGNGHNEIVLYTKKLLEHSDCMADADALSKFNEDQRGYMQRDVKKVCNEHSALIKTIDFGKEIEKKKNKENLW